MDPGSSLRCNKVQGISFNKDLLIVSYGTCAGFTQPKKVHLLPPLPPTHCALTFQMQSEPSLPVVTRRLSSKESRIWVTESPCSSCSVQSPGSVSGKRKALNRKSSRVDLPCVHPEFRATPGKQSVAI